MPLVSVVIPTYNRSTWVIGAIESIRRQTFDNLEIIVVDDGATDDTAGRVTAQSAEDPRVSYLYQANRGVSAARNAGLARARGEFIAFLDSDDLWLPQKLARQLDLLEKPDVDVVYCDFAMIDENGERLSDRPARPRSRGSLY